MHGFSIVIIALCALALMALEAFIPGVSLAGAAGVIMIGVSAYLCWNAYGAGAAIALLIACALLSFLIMRMVFRSMKSGKLSKSGMFLNEAVPPAVKAAGNETKVAVGCVGVAKTALHPAGIAEFDGARIHVASGQGFIEQGARITVVRIEGARIIVAAAEAESTSTT